MRLTVEGMRTAVLPTREVDVPEWEATVLFRALTRAHVIQCRQSATSEDGKLNPDVWDLAILACSFADPDLLAEVGLEEALVMLRAQPVALVLRLVREVVDLSGLAPGSSFRSRTADHDQRRSVLGGGGPAGDRRDDSRGDAAEDDPSGTAGA